jgi:hypothetical protein
MERSIPKLIAAAVLLLLTFSSLVAAPTRAVSETPQYGLATEPVWATVNAAAQGNYPGGNEIFDVFVVDSDQPPDGNLTIQNETLTAPALPADSNTNFAPGLPAVLAPGDSLLSTIALPIPGNFSQNNFTADLVVYTQLWNGSVNLPLKLTGTVVVDMLVLTSQFSTTRSTTQSTSQSTQTTQSGTVSTTDFAAGVAVPSLVALVLLILLVRAMGRAKKPGT